MSFESLTSLERARHIANTLLAHLPEEDQLIYIARARAVDETWLGASLMTHTVDEVVSTAVAASIVFVGPSTIRKWHSDGLLRAVSRGQYVVGEVLDCAAFLRQRRTTRRSA